MWHLRTAELRGLLSLKLGPNDSFDRWTVYKAAGERVGFCALFVLRSRDALTSW